MKSEEYTDANRLISMITNLISIRKNKSKGEGFHKASRELTAKILKQWSLSLKKDKSDPKLESLLKSISEFLS